MKDNEAVECINANRNYYYLTLEIAEQLIKKNKIEYAIDLIRQLAWYAYFNYSGFYTEHKIENALGEIASKMNLKTKPFVKKDTEQTRFKILHIATQFFETGGHTRILQRWIQNDSKNENHILLTNQCSDFVPDFICDLEKDKGVELTILNDSITLIERINIVREKCLDYDLVVLHHHPNDPVPVIALSVEGCPPVAILNHTDHLFWLGSSVCDCLIALRENVMEHNKVVRMISNSVYLSTPLFLKTTITRDEARKQLDVENKIILMSIGNSFKFKPLPDKNIFIDVISILNENESLVFYAVGLSPATELAKKYSHPQIKFIAPTSDISVYMQVCDIYIECYPVSSQTAVLEVSMLSMPVLLMYDPPQHSTYSASGYKNPVVYPKNFVEWKKILMRLIESKELRKEEGLKNQENILLNHTGFSWENKLNDIYVALFNSKHTVRKFDKTIFVNTNEETELYNVMNRNPFKNLYLMSFFKHVSWKLKIRILLNRKSFNLHSLRLFLFNLMQIDYFSVIYTSSWFYKEHTRK